MSTRCCDIFSNSILIGQNCFPSVSFIVNAFYWHNSIIHLFKDDLQAYLLSNELEYLPTFFITIMSDY